ncbi:MAG: NAD(P)-dependent oxidoreductase [Actinobacteria bacterium]|nr:NAD(P)-dependent oxidoreductase [Actinomycetota bacterium]MBO0818809.1 NAD(P)-dependent oxidoreductase [Actinomycetota bacterium]
MKVGFIGLGHMGLPMAGRLAASGSCSLIVWNRTPGRAASLAAAGAVLAESPQALAAECDLVITMLSDGQAVRAVMCGPDGVLPALRAGAIAVDMSTIGPSAAREIAAEAAAHGAGFLDAPVSGSVTLAEQGTLTVMAGGPPEIFERARPVLAQLSKTQLYLGPSGAGAAMKLAVNILIAATNQAIAEALTVAVQSGIGQAAAYDTLASSAVASPFIAYKREAFLNPGTTPVSFTTELMSKDLQLAMDVAGDTRLPVTTASKQFLDACSAAGFADEDFASVARVLRRESDRTEST